MGIHIEGISSQNMPEPLNDKHTNESYLSQREQKSVLRWLGGVLLWVAFLTLIVSFTIESSAQSLHFNANKNGWQAGLLINLGFVAQALGAFIMGPLGDRYGRRKPYLVALALAGSSGILAAFSWSLPTFIALRMLQSVGLGALLPLSLSIFSDLMPIEDADRPKAGLLLAAWYAWGTFLMPLLAGRIIAIVGNDLGWRLLLALGSVGLLVCAVGCRKVLISGSYYIPQSIQKTSMRRTWEDWKQLFGDKATWKMTFLLMIQWFAAYFLVTAYSNGLPALFKSYGLTSNSLLTTILYGLATLATIYLYAYGHRIGNGTHRQWMIGGYSVALAAACGALVLTGWQRDYPTSIPGWSIFWTSTFISLGSFIVLYGLYLMGSLYPAHLRSRSFASMRIAQCGATIIAPFTTPFFVTTGGIELAILGWAALAFLGWWGILTLYKQIHTLPHSHMIEEHQ